MLLECAQSIALVRLVFQNVAIKLAYRYKNKTIK